MRCFSVRTLLVFLFLVLLVSGCSKKADNITGPPGNGGEGGGTASDSLRNAVLDSIVAFTSQSPAPSVQAVLQFFRGRRAFEASGIAPGGSVWARFTDGKLLMYVSNFQPASAPPSPFNRSDGNGYGGRTENLPGSLKARILNSLGTAFEDAGSAEAVQSIRSWLDNAGYISPLGSSTAGVNDLKQVSGDGVFYMSAHGGQCYARDSTLIFGIWTADEASPANDARYKLDLDSDYVTYMVALHDNFLGFPTTSKHYGITPKFVSRYMSFGTNSLVYFNACSSNDPTLRAACMSKGATVYVGWTNPAGSSVAFHAARYLFDRLLGANQYEPENPHQRPFYYTLIAYDMADRGYDTCTVEGYPQAKLTFTPSFMPNSGTSLKLAPSILDVTPLVSPVNTMDIDGLFGSEQGTVSLGNTDLGIVNWASQKIRCTAPQTGGNLVVKVRGIKSNVVQLTQWHGQFNYTFNSRGSLQHHVLFDMTFWADVHTWRLLPHHQTYFFDPRFTHLSTSATCSYESTGEYRDQNDSLIESWSGSGIAPLLQTGNEPAYYMFVGVVDSSGANSTIVFSFRGTYMRNGTQNTFAMDGNLGTLSPRMNSSFVLPGNTLSWSSGTDHATMTWGDLQPTFPPDSNAAR